MTPEEDDASMAWPLLVAAAALAVAATTLPRYDEACTGCRKTRLECRARQAVRRDNLCCGTCSHQRKATEAMA